MTNPTSETDQDLSDNSTEAAEASDTDKDSGTQDKHPGSSSSGKITPIRVAIAIAAGLAAWQGFGLAKKLLSPARIVFEQHKTIVDLDEAVARAGIGDVIVSLTKGDGKLDIIFAGAPGCVHCQDFVSGGFDHYPTEGRPKPASFTDLVAAASEKGLDLAYMPLAMNSIDAAIAAGEACAKPADSMTAASRVQAAYSMAAPLNVKAAAVTAMIEAGESPDKIREALNTALFEMNETFSPGGAFDAGCYQARVSSYGKALSGYYQVFGQHGTPSFYFHEDTGTVRRFSGSGGVAAMLRQTAR